MRLMQVEVLRMSLVEILIVDDFKPWRQFVAATLQKVPGLRVIGMASDGSEAVQRAEELHPDLILLDLCLPKMSGIEAARRIRIVAPASRILFVSETRDLDVVRAALSVGACGYVLKSDAEPELLEGIDAVLLGKVFLSRSLAQINESADFPKRDQT
jgi:DNA-binding NarL/FixJ family response regulator